MDYLRNILKRRTFVPLTFFGLLTMTFVVYQNCAPANFRRLPSGVAEKGYCSQHPLDPACINPPGPSCDGFYVNKTNKLVLPYGQQTGVLNLRGALGSAPGPLQWTASPNHMIPIFGTNTNIDLAVGLYTVTGSSGDNSCSDSFQISVEAGQCPNPPTQSIDFQIVASPNPIEAGTPIQFVVNNFSSLMNPQVQWSAGAAFESIPAKNFSHTYAAAGTYMVTVRGTDRNCQDTVLTKTIQVVVNGACTPDINQIALTLLTQTPRLEAPVQFNVDNLGQLLNNTVEVEWLPGTKQSYSTNPASYTYPAGTPTGQYTLYFRSKDKKCQHVLERSYVINLQPKCVPQITALNVTADKGPDIFTTTRVNFTVGHVAADFATFNYNLGNGVTGTSVAVPNPQRYLTPTQPNTPVYAVFTASGPKTCGDTLQKKIPFNVTIQKFHDTFVVGESSVHPPIKMFWIVDNSDSMLPKQTTLANSFASMFSDTNVSNLKKFDNTFSVYNTTQISWAYGSVPYTSIPYVNSTMDPAGYFQKIAKSTNLTQLMAPTSNGGNYQGWRQEPISVGTAPCTYAQYVPPGFTKCPGFFYGAIPGDVIGFLTHYTTSPAITVSYDIAPVASFISNPTGTDMLAFPNLTLKPDSSGNPPTQAQVDYFVNDFKTRVGQLNPYKYNPANPYPYPRKYDSFTQNESAMCAVARILKDPNLIGPNDQATFVIVSDEDEYDISGNSCIAMSSQGIPSVYGCCVDTQVTGTRFTVGTGTSCRTSEPYNTQWYYTYDIQDPDTYDLTYEKRTCSIMYDGVCQQYTWSSYGPYSYSSSTQCNNAKPSGADYRNQTCTLNPGGTRTGTGTFNSGLIFKADGSKYGYGDTCADAGVTPPNSNAKTCQFNQYLTSTYYSCSFTTSFCQSHPTDWLCSHNDTTITDTWDINVANLQCGSHCPDASKCGTGTMQQYFASQDWTCEYADDITVSTNIGQCQKYFPSTYTGNKCPDGGTWNQHGTTTPSATTDYVAGTSATPDQYGRYLRNSLDQEILQRFKQLGTNGYKPMISAFVETSDPSYGITGAKGTKYMKLVNDSQNGQIYNILAPDFGQPLQQFTNFIKTILSSIFDISLAPETTIQSITFQRKSTDPTKVIAPVTVVSGWTYTPPAVAGNPGKLKFESKITVTGGRVIDLIDQDEFYVEWW